MTTAREVSALPRHPALPDVPTGLFIAGEWRASADGREFPVEYPVDGSTVASVADGTVPDALDALDAAAAAQAEWGATSARERAELLRRSFDALVARGEEFAGLISLESGKPLAEARAEVRYGAEFLRWFAEQTAHVTGDYGRSPEGDLRIVTVKQPVGPCLLITPWNFPLAMATRKIGAALAAGCTVIVKAAAQTPLTTNLLAGLMAAEGVPPGVLNVVPTTDAAGQSRALMADRRLRKVSFTGSTAVGSLLLEQAAPHVLRSSMELGGNGAFLVFDDADLDAAVAGAVVAKLRNGGQSCVAANRFLVHEDVAEAFVARFTEQVAAGRVGDAFDDGVTVGPLIDAAQQRKVAELVDDAVAAGARVACGGRIVDGPGHFYLPTVLTDVPRTARMWREEVFGPVAAIYTFRDEAEAVALANDTEYGLACYLFTADLARALRVGERLETGIVGVNRGVVSNPAGAFGGIKASGLGREGGVLGIEEYLETKYLALDAG
jgi:succinate-semialdehyde dehydrogenase/glutarate-semialdehyde dehydrogenase